jgi:sodium pump decarboxylase gamma subunit
MIEEGLRLMVVGMLTVFSFLSLMVGVMVGSAAFFEANAHRFPEDKPATAKAPGANQSKNDEEIAVAIALAEAMRRGQKV